MTMTKTMRKTNMKTTMRANKVRLFWRQNAKRRKRSVFLICLLRYA